MITLMFFVLYIYVLQSPLADDQPKRILHYEERINTGLFDFLFLSC